MRTHLMKKKLVILTLTLSLSQFISANEVVNTSTSMEAINQAHANVNNEDKKDQPFWLDQQKKQAELESIYLKAISDDPENKKNYAYLAGLYLTNNKTAKAIDAYQDAITYDAENPKLFAAISIAYLHQSRFDMAKAMADQALLLDPKMKQVEKINDYIVAKQEAIAAASKIPANPTASSLTGNMAAGHGAVMPDISSGKPKDAVHNPVK